MHRRIVYDKMLADSEFGLMLLCVVCAIATTSLAKENDTQVIKRDTDVSKDADSDKCRQEKDEVLELLSTLVKDLDLTLNKLSRELKDTRDVFLPEQLGQITNRLQQLEKAQVRHDSGSVYTLWGRKTCGRNEAELVYSGYAGGSYFTHSGGGANYLCLPRYPTYGKADGKIYNQALIYGAEYQTDYPNGRNFPFDVPDSTPLLDQDVPCAVCHLKEASAVLMIPARTTCYDGWTMEYSGYLMTSHYKQQRVDYACVDKAPEGTNSGRGNMNGALFYNVEGVCGSLPCPPYRHGWELACVVCSK